MDRGKRRENAGVRIFHFFTFHLRFDIGLFLVSVWVLLFRPVSREEVPLRTPPIAGLECKKHATFLGT